MLHEDPLFASNHTPAVIGTHSFLPFCNYTHSPVMAEIIKEGYLSVKEDGLRAWIWSKRFCILRDQTLTFHRNEVITHLENGNLMRLQFINHYELMHLLCRHNYL
jgi:hypothetical protein